MTLRADNNSQHSLVSSSPAYTINNYYILPDPTLSNRTFSSPAGNPKPDTDTLATLVELFDDLQIEEQARHTLIGALGAPTGSVNWVSLLTRYPSIRREHRSVLLEILQRHNSLR